MPSRRRFVQSLAVVAAIAAFAPPLARATGLPAPVVAAAWAARLADSQYRHVALASPMPSRRRFVQSLAVVAAIAAFAPPLARATGLPAPVDAAAWAGRFADSQYRHAVLASPMLSRRRFVQSLAVVTAFAPSLARATGLPEPGAVAALVGLPGLRGPALAAAEIAGRPLVVAFWASWCPPCRDEFVHLNRIHDAYADAGVAVIGVNVHEAVAGTADPERLARFLDGTAPRFRLVGGDADLLRIFGEIDAIPAVYVFDRLGEVTYAFQPSREPGRTHVTAGELARVLRNMGY